MKILLITDNHSQQGGGAEKQFFILKELLKNQPDVTVFSMGFGPQTIRGDDFVILKETRSKILRQCWRMLTNPIKYLQLRRLINTINPDIIHLHNIKKYTPALLKAIQGYPAMQTVHDFSSVCPTQWNVHQDLQPCATGFSSQCSWQHRRNYTVISYLALLFSFFRMRTLLKKSVAHFIAPSPFLTSYLEKNNFQPSTFIFPFHSVPARENKNEAQPNCFLYIGQLEKQKGVHVLLKEFHHALQKNPRLILKIAGDGSQKKAIQKKIKQWRLEDQIHLIDWCNNPTELYQQCCAVIFSSIGLESFGLVMIEAMAQSRPVIGSNRGPTAWLVEHEKTGLLFDPLQEGQLASMILKLSNDDFTLARTLGENAFEKAKAFPKNAETLAKIMGMYRSMLHQKDLQC